MYKNSGAKLAGKLLMILSFWFQTAKLFGKHFRTVLVPHESCIHKQIAREEIQNYFVLCRFCESIYVQ